MLTGMTFDEFRALAPGFTLVPVYREVVADLITPVSAFLRLGGPTRESFLFESVEGGERVARYSFLGCDPFLTVTAAAGRVTVEDRRGHAAPVVEATADPRPLLEALLRRYHAARVPGLPRFTGGAVGFFAYDAVRWVERLPEPRRDDAGHEEMVLRFYDTLLAFDHARRRLVVIANAHVTPDADDAALQAAWDEAQVRITGQLRALRGPGPAEGMPAWPPPGAAPATPVVGGAERPAGSGAPTVSNMERAGFESMVETALEHIRAGDIFQVVLSQRFARATTAAPFDIYRALRVINPSPYMFFLGGGPRVVLGASPEPLVRLQEGEMEYRPIAGTMPRGATDAEDAAHAAALLADEKERAEHVMLVDLGRNDLGRVARPGSVTVQELMVVERYSHVMHLVSRLTARLADGCRPLDVLFACLPAGTVSGAPKVRAMEIINTLEPTRRGIYAGAVGYLDFSGNLDTCIALRTMVVQEGTAYIQAGAGIVADSVPSREFDETAHKARALLRAVDLAEQGLA